MPNRLCVLVLTFAVLILALFAGPQSAQRISKGDSAKLYKEFRMRTSAEKKKELDQQLAHLQGLSEKYKVTILAAQKKAGFDEQQFELDLGAVSAARDSTAQQKSSANFHAKYEPIARRVAGAADIDPTALRHDIVSQLNLGNLRQRPTDFVGVAEASDQPSPTPTPVPAASNEPQISRAPFTNAGTIGSDDVRANELSGELSVRNDFLFGNSIQKLAFITKEIEIRPGDQRVRVSVNFEYVRYLVRAFVLAGYASAEARVNLRLMEGSHQLCAEPLSLSRVYAAVVWESFDRGDRPVQLACEYERPHPEDPATYTMVAEIESWVGGAGAPANAYSDIYAFVHDFRVYRLRAP